MVKTKAACKRAKKKVIRTGSYSEIVNYFILYGSDIVMASQIISTDKQYPKLSKAVSGYIEVDHFKNADLHTGYFCYNCTYFIKENHCAIVEDTGPDVKGRESGIIAPHGLCTLWDPNEEETK